MRCVNVVLAATLLGCVQSANSPNDTDSAIVVTTGTYFGFCHGYCFSELTVDGQTLRFAETSRDPTQFPPRSRTLELGPADRARIAALVDPGALAALEGIHGCPDCADGGGEWVQFRSGSDSTRVTFEFGQSLDPIAGLQAELRMLRKRFQ